MDRLLGFWQEVRQVWNEAAFDVGVGPILVGLIILFFFVLARGVFSKVFIGTLARLARRSQTEFDDELIAALERPAKFVFVVVGLYVAVAVSGLPEDVNDFMIRVVRSLIAFTIFWMLYRILRPLSFLVNKAMSVLGHDGLGDSLTEFFIKLARFVVVCVGIVAVLEEWDFNVGAVLGGLGLMGMAVAFGAQNLISNLFAGVSIFLDQIYGKGDWIRASGVEGTVEEIGFRTTKIRRFDKALTTVPNAKLAGDAVVNFSRMTNRRIYWKIGIEYGASESQLRQIVNGIRDHVHGSDDFETDPELVSTLIHVDSFNDSSIDIMLYCFTATTNWGEWMKVKEELAYRVKALVAEAGTGFAFPSTSVYVETLPFGTPENFPAAAG